MAQVHNEKKSSKEVQQLSEKELKRMRLREIMSILHKHNLVRGLTPEKLRLILEDLGPTFIKLGQIMSMQTNILPASFAEELEKLRANVPPMTKKEIDSVIYAEFKKKPNQIFDNFEYKPLGSASIAQAHRAVLKGTDTTVILKIQRKGIYEKVERDILLMRSVAERIRFIKREGVLDFEELIDELWKTTKDEMNFQVEAENFITFNNNHKERENATCPNIYEALTSSKVLVMEYASGSFIDDTDFIKENNIDIDILAQHLADDYIAQIVDDGFFHADPHPGNIKITKEGKIIWLDLGMVGKLSERDRELIGDLLLSLVRKDILKLKDIALSIGIPQETINHSKLYGDLDIYVSKYASADLGNFSIAKSFQDLLKILEKYKISVPANFTMLGRGLMTIEGIFAKIAPETNVMEIAQKHLKGSEMTVDRLVNTAKQVMFDLSTSGEKAVKIPALTADILGMVAKGQLKMNSEVEVSSETQSFISRMLNRLIIGLIIVALILGSSLIARVSFQPTIFNLPLFTLLGYFIAFIMAIVLLFKK